MPRHARLISSTGIYHTMIMENQKQKFIGVEIRTKQKK